MSNLRVIGFVLLLLVGAYLLGRSGNGRPDDGHGMRSAAIIATEAARADATLRADTYRDVAERIKSGEITEAADAHKALKDGIAAARDAAWQPLDDRINDEIGENRWDTRKAVRLYTEIDSGLRKR